MLSIPKPFMISNQFATAINPPSLFRQFTLLGPTYLSIPMILITANIDEIYTDSTIYDRYIVLDEIGISAYK